MSFFSKSFYAVVFSSFLAASAFGNSPEKCGCNNPPTPRHHHHKHKHHHHHHHASQVVSMEFTLLAAPIVGFREHGIFIGSFQTRDSGGNVIDSGYFVDDVQIRSEVNDLCNANQFDNIQTIRLYGTQGNVTMIIKSKTALGGSTNAVYKDGEGIYRKWAFSKNMTITADCDAPSNQYIINTKVKLD